jgi:hypothetical protein
VGFSSVEIHGAMIAPLRRVYLASDAIGKRIAKILDPIDPLLTDSPLLRHFLAEYLIAIGRK